MITMKSLIILLISLTRLLSLSAGEAEFSLETKRNAEGYIEYYYKGKQVERELYAAKQVEYGRKFVTLNEEDSIFYDTLRHFNWSGDLDSLAVVERELRDPQSKYHESISSMLDLDEASLPAYLEYAKTETTYSGRFAIALALREATPTDAVVELLEAMIAERNNDGLISEMAISALEKHQATRSAAADKGNALVSAADVDESEEFAPQVAEYASRSPLNEINVEAEPRYAPAEPKERSTIWLWLLSVVVTVGVILIVRRKS